MRLMVYTCLTVIHVIHTCMKFCYCYFSCILRRYTVVWTICNLYSIRIWPNRKSYNSHLAQYSKVVIRYSNMFHDNKPVFPAIHNWPCKVQLSLTMYHIPCMLVYQKQNTIANMCNVQDCILLAKLQISCLIKSSQFLALTPQAICSTILVPTISHKYGLHITDLTMVTTYKVKKLFL